MQPTTPLVVMTIAVSVSFYASASARTVNAGGISRDVELLLLQQQSTIEALRRQLEAVTQKLNAQEKLLTDSSRHIQTLRALTNKLLPRNCMGLQDLGLTENGMYFVDPDGPTAGRPPIEVFCDFSTGTTRLPHDSMDPITIEGCSDPGCFTHSINYHDVTDFQITSLIASSESCSQKIEYTCYSAPLTEMNTDWAWWVGPSGDPQNYWSGYHPGNHTCACGENGACVNPQLKCECDAKNPEWFVDSGLVEGPELPVKTLYFGGLVFDDQRATFQVGPLECNGKAPAEKPQACSQVRLNGAHAPGYYWVSPKDGTYKLTHCDMNFPTTDIQAQEDTHITLQESDLMA